MSRKAPHRVPGPPTPRKPLPVVRGECVHLGDILDRLGKTCQRCWVRACEKHGTCTTGVAKAGVVCCLKCKDFFDENTPPDMAMRLQSS